MEPETYGLFSELESATPKVRLDAHAPLAEKQRPRTLDDLLGQEAIWGQGAALRRLVEQDRYTALIFWGPPGSGKTSLALLMGQTTSRPVALLSAVRHGVKDIRAVLDESAARAQSGGPPTLVFMDEIHRLSKSQQDTLLPALESGIVRFVGATTENPSFEVNRAILSRCLVFKFERLSEDELVALVKKALVTPGNGLSRRVVEDDLLVAIARSADGDARRALNLLDAVIAAAPEPERADEPLSKDAVRHLGASLSLAYDKVGDQHYDTISAFIKSIRAGQPDAAVYYLARMLDAGEDPVFIARRLVIAASEDVGNANPTALLVAHAAMQSAHMLGMPEARIVLSQATTYLAASPKSNRAYVAINSAMEEVKRSGSLEIPMHLRNAPTALMREFGYGRGYVYAHDDQKGAAQLDYLPEALRGVRFYEPLDVGAEATLKKNLGNMRAKP